MDSYLAEWPMVIAVVAAAGGFYLSQKRTGQTAAKLRAASAIVAVVGVVISLTLMWGGAVARGELGFALPAIAIFVLCIAVVMFTLKSLRPTPPNAEGLVAARRRFDAYYFTLIAVFSVLVPYGIGYWFGSFAGVELKVPWLPMVIAYSAAAVVVLALIPVAVMYAIADRRRRAVESGHPMSAEVADHAFKMATQEDNRYLYSTMDRGMLSRLIVPGAAAFCAILLPVFGAMLSSVQGVNVESTLVITQICSVVLLMLGVLWFIFDLFIVAAYRDARVSLLFSSLSELQRAKATARVRGLEHRFEDTLDDAHRSVKVLRFDRDGSHELVDVAAIVLLASRSEPATIEAVHDIYLTLNGMRAAGPLVRQLEDSRLEHGVIEYDVFIPGSGTVIYLVAAGADDYVDFPEAVAERMSSKEAR